ncbi:MAG: hypothetical protein N2506_06540 [Dehalococcoidales bacterium]|nr:hypothetical protein [Dehalococcoidales bacterium]
MKIAEVFHIGEAPYGARSKQLRVRYLLTQEELAALARVPARHVDLFERGLPVPLDSRRRILKVLWAMKAQK